MSKNRYVVRLSKPERDERVGVAPRPTASRALGIRLPDGPGCYGVGVVGELG